MALTYLTSCPRCGLQGHPTPGVGHMCFHPKTGETYAAQCNRNTGGQSTWVPGHGWRHDPTDDELAARRPWWKFW